MAWVQSCADADFNTSTMTCSVPIWTPETSSLPTMSIADAQSIGTAIALLWATAWAFRMCKKALQEIG
jgi:hypothetical protein